MRREDLMNPDLLSEIVLLGSAAVIVVALLLIVVAALTQPTALTVVSPHSRHIQQSCCLDGSDEPRTSWRHAEQAGGERVLRSGALTYET
jgi:hypothetical protein